MKKVLFLTTFLLVCLTVTTFAQTSKDARAARREALKKERQERKALEAQQDTVAYLKAVEALKAGSFVLEADFVTFPNGITRYVSSNTNYIQVDNGEGIVQTAFTNFTYSPGPNGLGGVTVEGNISGLQMKSDKDGNYYYSYTIQGMAISATVFITLTGGTNQANVSISPNFNGNNMTMTGRLLPLDESDVFQGTTWSVGKKKRMKHIVMFHSLSILLHLLYQFLDFHEQADTSLHLGILVTDIGLVEKHVDGFRQIGCKCTAIYLHGCWHFVTIGFEPVSQFIYFFYGMCTFLFHVVYIIIG